MTQEEAQVRKFYEVIWNRQDKTAIPEVLSESFLFRGSLGDEKRGHDGFAEYLDAVHAALDDYRCTIKELVIEPGKAFARMEFAGLHRGELMGVQATGKRVWWAGAALFHFSAGKIDSLWVLGDLKGLEAQLFKNGFIAGQTLKKHTEI